MFHHVKELQFNARVSDRRVANHRALRSQPSSLVPDKTFRKPHRKWPGADGSTGK